MIPHVTLHTPDGGTYTKYLIELEVPEDAPGLVCPWRYLRRVIKHKWLQGHFYGKIFDADVLKLEKCYKAFEDVKTPPWEKISTFREEKDGRRVLEMNT